MHKSINLSDCLPIDLSIGPSIYVDLHVIRLLSWVQNVPWYIYTNLVLTFCIHIWHVYNAPNMTYKRTVYNITWLKYTCA